MSARPSRRRADQAAGMLERFSLALEAAHAGWWEWDLATNANTWSPELFPLYGLDPAIDTPSYDTWLRSIHPDDVEAAVAAVQNAARDGTELNAGWRVRTPDGTERWLMSRGRPRLGRGGRATHYIGVVIDVTERRRAEQAAREAEARTRAMLDSLAEGVVFLDTNGVVTSANASATRIQGRTADDLAGPSVDPRGSITRADGSPFPEEEQPAIVALRTLQAVRNVEMIVPLVGGGSVWLDVSAQPVRDSDGRLLGAVASFFDVTTRRKAEAQLAEERSRWKAVVAGIPDEVWLADVEGRATLVNKSEFESLGVAGPRESTIAQIEEDVEVLEADGSPRPASEAPIVRALTGESVRGIERLRNRATGTERWREYTAAPVRDAVGSIAGAVAVARDVTESKEAERALREAEEALRSLNAELERRVEERTAQLQKALAEARDLYDHAPCGYHSLDEEGRFVDMNATELGWLGYALDELIGRPAAELLAPGSMPVLAANFPRLKEIGRLTDVEIDFVRKDGSLLPVLLQATVLRDVAGRFLRTRSTVTEMSELRQARARLEAANRELETFTYSVSHDLKAPLRAIDGYSRLLQEEHAQKLDDEGREFVANIRRGVVQMARLIEDLLAYSRVERRTLRTTAVEPARVVEELLLEREDEIRTRGIRVDAQVPPGTIEADREGVALVLRNLVDNALKFTRDTPAPRIEIGGEAGARALRVWVRDNGVGFDMRYHDRIFEIFQRLHRAEDYPGTGVGLAIVRKAAERLGGRTWAESAPGEGATFYLELPR